MSNDAVVSAVRAKLSSDTSRVDGWVALAAVYHMRSSLAGALRAVETALTLDPASPSAITVLSAVMNDADDPLLAVKWADRGIIAGAETADIWLAKANAHAVLEEERQAIDAYYNAANFDVTATNTNLGIMQLAMHGPNLVAWNNYDQRWRGHGGFRARARFPHLPRWEGDHGHRIVVWPEQGIGDEVVFFSMAGDLVRAGHDVTWICDSRLVPVFQRSAPKVRVMPDSPESALWASQHCDVQSSSGSLARILRLSLSDFFTASAYLQPAPSATARGWMFLEEHGLQKVPVVGISWRSLRTEEGRHHNYCSLEDLLPILQAPRIRAISLQPGYYEREIDQFERKHGIQILRPSIDTWGDLDGLAGLLSVLDLVIGPGSFNTTFAAALGTPAWQLAPSKMRDWMALGTDRYPWLPMLKLFRRGMHEKDWRRPIAAMAEALR